MTARDPRTDPRPGDVVMDFTKYYVVEVAFNKHNIVHMAIAGSARFDQSKGSYFITLWNSGYEYPNKTFVSDLAHFRIVSEISDMKLKPSMITPGRPR